MVDFDDPELPVITRRDFADEPHQLQYLLSDGFERMRLSSDVGSEIDDKNLLICRADTRQAASGVPQGPGVDRRAQRRPRTLSPERPIEEESSIFMIREKRDSPACCRNSHRTGGSGKQPRSRDPLLPQHQAETRSSWATAIGVTNRRSRQRRAVQRRTDAAVRQHEMRALH